jgi:hypothetical protein
MTLGMTRPLGRDSPALAGAPADPLHLESFQPPQKPPCPPRLRDVLFPVPPVSSEPSLLQTNRSHATIQIE